MKHSFINLHRKDDAPSGGFSAEEKAELKQVFSDIKKDLNTELTEEIKTAVSNATKPLNDEISTLKTELNEEKEINKANQPVIDAFVVQKDRKPVSDKPKTFEQALADAVYENEDQINKFLRKEIKGFDIKLAGDMTTGNVTSGTRYGQQFAPNIIQQPYRKVHVRDLLPVSAAGPGNTYTFMKELTTGEGDVAFTAETSTKPQLDLDLAEATVNFETLAGWLRVTKKAMRNIPGFIAWLQQRLPEKLMRVEDEQLLYGNGATPNIKGIGVAGNFTAATSGSTNIEEALIDALSQLEDDLERYATGIVVRPRVYFNFFKNKAVDSGVYDLPKNFVFTNNILYISGVPVIPTTAVHTGDYFVGDFIDGAQLLVQEGMRLEFFEQDGTNVRENKVTIRIEETVAFPVFGESFFVKGNDADES